MSPLASYRRLFAIVGPAYIVVAFLGRIPLAMSQLGALVLVSRRRRARYASAGCRGRTGGLQRDRLARRPGLADRIGQRPVVLVQSLAGAAGLAGIVVVTTGRRGRRHADRPRALTGFVMPQVGPLARVRWRPITRDAGDQRAARRRRVLVRGRRRRGVVRARAGDDRRAGDRRRAGRRAARRRGLLAVFGSWFAVHPTSALAGRRADSAAAAGSEPCGPGCSWCSCSRRCASG